MPTFYDSLNQPHVLSERIGSGGEGAVYACAEDFNLVAKIYHEPVSEEKAEKLRWMAANKNAQLLKVAAWVVDVLRDAPDGGRVVGFLMPNVKAKEIHELYSLKSRRVYFPEATWHFLVHTAANVARAFYNLHTDAHIMGDVNHGNCVVMRDGTVKLIDCDSYSIKTDKRRYKCEVGVATHLAPELQGVNLSKVERENKHDNFGLAIIIFQLLFLGRHPFAGNYTGAEDKSLEDCIREYRFAYGANASLKDVRQPPGTLQLSAVSPRVALLFERAFLTEDRPDPREWIEALEDLSLNLEQCSLHPGHLYFKELAACPWCEIETQTGLMLFPFVTSGSHLNGDAKPFNIFTVENLIASLGIQNNLSAAPLPQLPAAVLPPSPEILDARRDRRRMNFYIVSAHFFGLILLMWAFGVGAAFFFGILTAFFLIAFIHNSHQSVRQPLEETLADNQRRWEKAENERRLNDVPQIIGDDLIKIRRKVADYQNVQVKSVNQLKLLQTEAATREIYKFLHSKTINEAEIPGIDNRKRKSLIAAGIKTAAEIDENRLRYFYKIDDEITSRLLEWHGRLADEFKNDARAIDALRAEQTEFINEINGERRQIERDIEQLLILLRAGAVHLHKQQHEFSTKSLELARQIAQIRIDLRTLGGNIPAVILLILITLFVPMLGVINNIATSRHTAPRSSNTGGSAYGSSQTDSLRQKPVPHIPDENFTDEEINRLTAAERADYAGEYYNKAISYSYGTINHAKAEQYSRQAIRFVADDTRFLNELGYALYSQGKYDESLRYLNRSRAIEKRNSDTRIFIAMNYLATERFEEAVKILNEVNSEYSNLFEAFYNLGLAYKGLKDYAKAETAFRRSIQLNPDETEAHYQLGYCLYKLEKWVEVRQEYNILLNLDKTKAEKLRTDTNLELSYGVEVQNVIQ